jgi:DNA-binding MarR family transcriptional regulator
MNKETKFGKIARELWFKAAIVSKQLDNSLGAIHGIGLAEYMVLLNLMKAPNRSLRRIDLAEALARTGSGITRMLMPMEKIGLISKDTNARDARVSLVKITPAGEALFNDASATLETKSERLLSKMDDDEANQLLALLTAI